MSDDQRKRKKKQYFIKKAKKSRKSLEPGLKGFLCTCNQREMECLRETYNILNEYADKLYGEEVLSKQGSDVQPALNKKIVFKDSDDEDDSEGDDIQSALAREVDALKEAHNVAPSQRRFQAVGSGAKNCLFVRTTVDDPVGLVESILKDIELTQQQKTRFLLRLLPVEVTCKAWPDDIKLASEKLLLKYFGGNPKTFCVAFNRRNNSNVPREELINQIAGDIKSLNPLHRAEMKQPDLTVIVEVICSIVCLSVVPKYYQYRKYNLIELSKAKTNITSQKVCENISSIPVTNSEHCVSVPVSNLSDPIKDCEISSVPESNLSDTIKAEDITMSKCNSSNPDCENSSFLISNSSDKDSETISHENQDSNSIRDVNSS